MTLLFSAAGFGDTFYFKPAFQLFPKQGRVQSYEAPLIPMVVNSEGEACNQAAYLVGTIHSQEIKTTICYGSTGSEHCQKETLHSGEIEGGAIMRAQDESHPPTKVSQINEIVEPHGTAAQLCSPSLSWDPDSEANRKWARSDYHYHDQYGVLKVVKAGMLNPQRSASDFVR